MQQTDTRSVAIVVHQNHLRHNLAVARRLSGSSKLFATVKADAYGHGAVAVAEALSSSSDTRENADGFAVVTLGEALELREAGINAPILLLQGPQTLSECDAIADARLWPVIHDLEQLEWFETHPRRSTISAWLKVDTGMGRLGLAPSQAVEVLQSDTGIRWMGVMSHFASADETSNDFTLKQIDSYSAVQAVAADLAHSLANSAAILAWPQSIRDWARPGIMLYGSNPLDAQLPEGVELKPAMTVTAPVVSVKHHAAGSGIGYAQSWFCPEDMAVGYVGAGYGDGVPRVLDKSANVIVDGVRCPIIGRVSMDSFAIDLRALAHPRRMMKAELWGNNAAINSFAAAADTISYELLTGIRGERRYTS